MEIKTILSQDKIAPYNDYGIGTPITKDCCPRSIRFNHLTGKELDFGMIFTTECYNLHGSNQLYAPERWYGLYSYHVWNYDDDYIYDSQRQVDCRVKEGIHSPFQLVGRKVLVFDIEHLTPFLSKKWSESKFRLVKKVIKDYTIKAERMGFSTIYFSGLSFGVLEKHTLEMGTTEWWNDEVDHYENNIVNYFSKNACLV